MEGPAVMQFDGWSLHADSGELSQGAAKVRLQEQSLQFLLELLAHPGQVVTREQLIARLWPKGVVDFDTNLNSVVRKLRVALRDSATAPRYIETIPRKGYRFICPLEPGAEAAAVPETERTRADPVETAVLDVAPVEGSEPATSPAAATLPILAGAWRGAWRRIYTFTLVVLVALAGGLIVLGGGMRSRSEAPSVLAVLPLVNKSDEPGDALLSSGLTEELSAALSQVPGLQVIAHTSAFAFKETIIEVTEIGRRLHATHVIEGSLQRQSAALRINVRLVTTADGVQQWSGSFDIKAADRLHIQERVIAEVANQLRLQLEPQILERIALRGTQSRAASEHFLKARALWRERAPEANRSAIELYSKAILEDRNYALAYVGLAEAYLNQIHLDGMSVEEAADLAGPQIRKALRLQSRLPDALAANAWLLAEQLHLDAAAELLQRALESSPNDAAMRGKLARVLGQLGQPQQALEQYRQAAKIDPLDANVHMQQCYILQDLASFEAADQECELARKSASKSPWGYFATAHLMRNQGRLDAALKWNQHALMYDPENPMLLVWHIELQLMLGLEDEADGTHRRSVRVSPGDYDRSLVGILLVREGKQALLEYLQSVDPALITSGSELIDLAKAYHLAGDGATATRLFAKVERLPGSQRAYFLDPTEVANEYAGSLYRAAARLANGERDAGNAELDALEAMLGKLEAAGVDCHGLYSLRAQAQVLRGNHDAAMVSLQRAAKRGWLWTWRAQHEPYLAPLRTRQDYRALMAKAEQRITELRAATLDARKGRLATR